MNYTYIYEMQHHYLLIEEESISGEEYVLKMLERNPAQPFLRLQMRSMNGTVKLMYDVSGKQPLTIIFERRQMEYEDISCLLRSLEKVCEQAQRLLLDPDAILLTPESLFRNRGSKEVEFLYFPGAQKEGSLKSVAEFVLKKLNHADQRAVNLGYAFYESAGDRRMDFRDILDQVRSGMPDAVDPFSGSGDGLVQKDTIRTHAADEDMEKEDEYWLQDEPWEIFPDEDQEEMQDRKRGVKRSTQKDNRYRKGIKRNKTDRKRDSDQDIQRSRYNRGRNSRPAGKRIRSKKEKCRLLYSLAGILGLTLLYGLLVWLFRMDLFQMIGLFTLFIAVIWLAWNTISSSWSGEEHLWDDLDFRENEDEEAFLEALMEEDPDLYSVEKDSGFVPDLPAEPGKMTEAGRFRESSGFKAVSGNERNNDPDETSGPQTRYLGARPGQRLLCLVSQDIRRCRDLEMESEVAVIGKQDNEADLCIRNDAVSRTHAKIERDPVSDTYYLTDLNSTNGTFINQVQASPFRKYPIRDGDRVSFATLHFRVKI